MVNCGETGNCWLDTQEHRLGGLTLNVEVDEQPKIKQTNLEITNLCHEKLLPHKQKLDKIDKLWKFCKWLPFFCKNSPELVAYKKHIHKMLT